jgi:succinate-semialdehyde dehydrogenase/glutarate-semialdehyde dehydrogenase
VVNVVVPKPAGEAVAALLTGGVVRKLSFTGSTPVGATLLATASKNIVNCSMELGGNAPFIVYADADLDAAVDGAMIAKMRNGGAACTAANRFYVEAPVVAEFIDRFSARMGALVLGNGLDAATGLGPMVTRSEQKHVAELVERAIGEGAKAVVGGELPDGPGFGYPATVLADVSPTASIINEEIFGPVAPIVSFDRADEMIGWANGVEHGLVSYVFTRDIGKGMRTAEALESGMVGLNRGIVSDPAAPFGGYKQSGIGREGAHDGLLEFCETKYVAGSW